MPAGVKITVEKFSDEGLKKSEWPRQGCQIFLADYPGEFFSDYFLQRTSNTSPFIPILGILTTTNSPKIGLKYACLFHEIPAHLATGGHILTAIHFA